MNQDFFEKLPPEITVNILSRLPVRTVVCCKCVCKPWLDLVGTSEFVKSHLSKSIPALLMSEYREPMSMSYVLSDFDDGLDLEHYDHHYNSVTKFSLPYLGKIYGSINGLFFFREKSLKPDGLFICNPITRDYIRLDCPQEFACRDKHVVAYGFGVSKISGEYKVVRISHKSHEKEEKVTFSKPEWHVYTLGTGAWRRIAAVGPIFLYGHSSFLGTRNCGAFLNGKLHWRVYDLHCCLRICCFDLETETFCGFSTPPSLCHGSLGGTASLCVFRDSLCLCDNNRSKAEIVIWLMKEHDGGEKSWEEVLVIAIDPQFFPLSLMIGLIFPLKIFEDGDILLESDGSFLFRYSKKDKVEHFFMFGYWHEAIIHTPSFLSLKSFNTEDVSAF